MKMTYKEKILEIVSEKSLVSLMNDTKWRELVDSVYDDLPFAPPYKVKYITAEEPYPVRFDTDVSYHGDWLEGLHPFYSVEWIRVRPRYLKPRGRLIDPEVIDTKKEFQKVFEKHSIPYAYREDSFWIYGYAEDTSELHK